MRRRHFGIQSESTKLSEQVVGGRSTASRSWRSAGPSRALAWIDAAERVGKAVLRVGTLGAASHFGRAAVGAWGVALSLAGAAGILVVSAGAIAASARHVR